MRTTFAVAFLLATAFLSGCMGDDDDNGSTTTTTTAGMTTTTMTTTVALGANEVSMTENNFTPNRTTVRPATTVTFTNDGIANHTVTIHYAALDQMVKNETVAPGEDTTHDFTLPGTYHVWCRFHGTMTTGMAMVVTVSA